MDVLGLLLSPARLTLRALDDLHALVDGVRELNEAAARLQDAVERMERVSYELRDGGRRLERIGEHVHGDGEQIIDVGERVHARSLELLAAAGDVLEGERALLDVAERLRDQADEAEDTVEPIARLAGKIPGNRG